MRKLPEDYLERAYAAVLGKLIGVYLGRPFENWSHRRILGELGPIEYYVHDRLGCPLIVTDDDISGTFTFVRAMEDHGLGANLTAKAIGETWLNYIIENRAILWWGGNGISTEHTAWLNLSHGLAAPMSGSIVVNGRSVAEQIGAQIFIDGWALLAPGDPSLAARLAREAASVSHDGAAVDGAVLWAAMEAEAFASRDIEHLLDVGLAHISPRSPIATLIADLRRWRGANADWRDTRDLIEKHHGYDRRPGLCHVIPNHALMVMAILYSPDDFSRAQQIVCTSGWDTDCNAGNVGCLMGVMLGLPGLEAGRDWRGPIADRMLISSADGGAAINDAARVAIQLVNAGRALAGAKPLRRPKGGARFHFSLPGSVQGFRAESADGASLKLRNVARDGKRALELSYDDLGAEPVAALTPTFASRDDLRMGLYELMATPLISSGQIARARVSADASNDRAIEISLRLLVYGRHDELRALDGDAEWLAPGEAKILSWSIPDTDGQPIQSIGVAPRARGGPARGIVWLDWLRWDGPPELRLRRPTEPGEIWRRGWVNAVDHFWQTPREAFRVAQDRGEGLLIHGGRDWTDYRMSATLTVSLAEYAGLAVRVQGLRRYYSIQLVRPDRLRIIKKRNGVVTTLAEIPFAWSFDTPYDVSVEVSGSAISAWVGATRLGATDDDELAFADGGAALIISGGAMSTDEITITAAGANTF